MITCPFGRINDPYPGLCDLYIDTNNNQICDYSEPGLSSPIFWYIFLPAVLYFLHWYLMTKTNLGKRNKFFTLSGFKYFWNLILLVSFIPAGILGLVLATGVTSSSLLSWHIYGGVVFTVVALGHIILRLRYFLKK